MSISERGFASMKKDRQKEIARLGGIVAHKHGTAHEWTKEEARIAGKKGGLANRRKRKLAEAKES